MSAPCNSVVTDPKHVQLTILRRKGKWQMWEVAELLHGLRTEVRGSPRHKEFLLVLGHFSEDQIMAQIDTLASCVVTHVTGVDNPEVPFVPSFVS